MMRLLAVLLGLVICIGATSSAVAEHPDGSATAEEAAAASFARMLPDWNIVGECNTSITPEPADVCYRFTPGRSTSAYSIYSAFTYGVPDTGWWVGVIQVEGGWKVYDGGRCDTFYCRLANPGDNVLFGFPGGNVDCAGGADSQDALLILQVVAQLITIGDLPCGQDADVFPRDGLDSLDALAILQSSAGLIGALPAVDPDRVL